MKEIKFTTEVEYNDNRTSVKVEATFSKASSEQEYPGAYKWNYPSTMEIKSMIIEGTETDILGELSSTKIKTITEAAWDVLAGDKPSSEYSHEDEMEDREAARFEDMAYGPPDYD